jgi:hypothetical protein
MGFSIETWGAHKFGCAFLERPSRLSCPRGSYFKHDWLPRKASKAELCLVAVYAGGRVSLG